jgi:hypothetical protein
MDQGRLYFWGKTPRGLSLSSSSVNTSAAGGKIHCFFRIMAANSPRKNAVCDVADWWVPCFSAASFWAIFYFRVLSFAVALVTCKSSNNYVDA